ncbi:MAG: hypothetical protein A2Y00_09565 [Omnitrophica WOR_2 bacterium GWF2_43_52]|nr:MAG: hypothetical protein A2Y00_09565 [Omnitrophica WOR_2 bacterium GWF2_43_52]OGX53487.1 MAG: hypothetical protein A2460_08285 [Omnitrophica WOR_2 bacterium RIFOXYC2_FULL_43_9]HBG63734.1 hypothetical protein [Candidatus Omnitrophota bacterium]HCD38089.1 hypothetical protein [Candidatus Omnitrophota bacterium]
MFKKIISLFLSLSMIFTQPVFAQGIAELNIGQYLTQMPLMSTDKFRPLHLRYFSYDSLADNFNLLLDKGDLKDIKDEELQDKAKELLNYFLIGISLPNDKFWVNLRPDAESQIIDPELERTDIGKILLEADLQLKKDTANFTSPQTPEGKSYWDKLYKRAGELFGTENITIPTITRPWIVPGEVIIRESEDSGSASLSASAYVYKANLKVMLEEDYLRETKDERRGTIINYSFKDLRLKELNQYSTQLIRELILPKLTKEVNTAKRYASLRQVYFSLILSRWFKDRFGEPVNGSTSEPVNPLTGKPANPYSKLIDSHNLTNLTSKEQWNTTTYFNEYKKSFEQGEYNLKETVPGLYGQSVRSYMSGGTDMTGKSEPLIKGGFKAGSPLFKGKSMQILDLIAIGFVSYVLGAFSHDLIHRVPPEPTLQEVMLSIQADYDARRAILDMLDDKNISWEDFEKLRSYLVGFAGLENKELLGRIKEALAYFRGLQHKENIVLRLEEIYEMLKKTSAGSSPLTQVEARKQVRAQFDLLNRNPSFKDQSEWKDIDKKYPYYADFKIDEEKYLDTLNSGITRLVRDVNAIKDTVLKNAAQVLVDKFKALSKAAALELGVMN